MLDLQRDMDRHRLSSVALTGFYLARIHRLNPWLHAVIETNPDAVRDAVASDLRRAHHLPAVRLRASRCCSKTMWVRTTEPTPQPARSR